MFLGTHFPHAIQACSNHTAISLSSLSLCYCIVQWLSGCVEHQWALSMRTEPHLLCLYVRHTEWPDVPSPGGAGGQSERC